MAELVAGGRAGRSGICAQSEETKTSGTGIWLDQICGGNATNEVSRETPGGVDVPTRGGGAELETHATVAACHRLAKGNGKGIPEPERKWPLHEYVFS